MLEQPQLLDGLVLVGDFHQRVQCERRLWVRTVEHDLKPEIEALVSLRGVRGVLTNPLTRMKVGGVSLTPLPPKAGKKLHKYLKNCINT